MFFKVAAAAGEVLRSEVEGFGFVVRLLTLNYAIEDADEFVRGGDEAFGFAGPSLPRAFAMQRPWAWVFGLVGPLGLGVLGAHWAGRGGRVGRRGRGDC